MDDHIPWGFQKNTLGLDVWMDPKNIPKTGSDLEPGGWWFFPLLIEELFRGPEFPHSAIAWHINQDVFPGI